MALTSSVPVRTVVARAQRRSGLPKGLLISTELLVPVLLLVIWWVASAGSTNTFLPPLQAILERLVTVVGTPQFWGDLGSSVGNLLLSFVLACVIGVLLGIFLGTVRWLSWLVEPTIHFFRAIPPVALVPIFVSLIGFGNETRLLSITLSAVFPVLISTIDGIHATDPDRTSVGMIYRLGWWDRIVTVALPEASPRIFSGMQVSLITAFVVMVASEMLGSSSGLGARTLQAQQSFMITDMWVGILVLGILGYVATAVLSAFRQRVLRWYIAIRQQEKNL
ncbi:ABC transporter permease [Microbacterium sp.]|uniref:ABC transporter permease n=1 Tax=Microbacterium sp. TaxID=51671 RepID=UPI003A836745